MRISATPVVFIGMFVAFALGIAACSDSGLTSSDTSATEQSATSSTDAPNVATTTSSGGSSGGEAPTPVVFDDDFGTSIAPILTNRCASCHNPGGPGTAHWQLESASDAAQAANAIMSLVGSEVMPPWPAGDLSVPFHNDRSLSQDELDAILQWGSEGAELDIDPETPMIADQSLLELDEVTAVLTPESPYQGSVDNTDDYRCLVYDPELDSDAWLLGYNFVADQTEVVHHAIGYLLPNEARERAAAADANDEGAGWECYGASGLGQDDIFIGWAPGQGPSSYPDGAALRIPAGAFFVIQIHYHFEDSAPADLSMLEVHLDASDTDYDEVVVAEYVAPAEIPCMASQTGPLCDRAAAYARALERFGPEGVRSDAFNAICGVTPSDFAGMTDGLASSSCDLPIYGFGKIISILGHQHELGASFRMTLNPGKPNEKILLDIPRWDFDWQYNYEPTDVIVLNFGDTVRIECTWDRSLQAPGIEPSYILWANGTNDEMCFSTIVTQSLN